MRTLEPRVAFTIQVQFRTDDAGYEELERVLETMFEDKLQHAHQMLLPDPQSRSMSFTLPKIYPITDTLISGLSHAEQIELLAAGGASLIQLREKRASPREFYQAALEAMLIARMRGVQIIINDRVDIAIAVKADGVHLGQDDLPPDRARSLLGESRIIGFSTHTLEQALAADSAPVDYVAIGPIFQTFTKDRPDPVVGLETVSAIKRRISKPLVAIGGITLQTASSVIEAGADSIAVISDLLSARDIPERTRAFLTRFAQSRV